MSVQFSVWIPCGISYKVCLFSINFSGNISICHPLTNILFLFNPDSPERASHEYIYNALYTFRSSLTMLWRERSWGLGTSILAPPHFPMCCACIYILGPTVHAQGKRNPSKMVGVARGHERADALKPYSQKTSQSNHTRTTALSNSMKPRRMGHGGEVWQNVVHWRREWQTTSVFLPCETHEQYEKAFIDNHG